MFYMVEYTETSEWDCIDTKHKFFRTKESALNFIENEFVDRCGWKTEDWTTGDTEYNQIVKIETEECGDIIVYKALITLFENGKETCSDEYEICYLCEKDFED